MKTRFVLPLITFAVSTLLPMPVRAEEVEDYSELFEDLSTELERAEGFAEEVETGAEVARAYREEEERESGDAVNGEDGAPNEEDNTPDENGEAQDEKDGTSSEEDNAPNENDEAHDQEDEAQNEDQDFRMTHPTLECQSGCRNTYYAIQQRLDDLTSILVGAKMKKLYGCLEYCAGQDIAYSCFQACTNEFSEDMGEIMSSRYESMNENAAKLEQCSNDCVTTHGDPNAK